GRAPPKERILISGFCGAAQGTRQQDTRPTARPQKSLAGPRRHAKTAPRTMLQREISYHLSAYQNPQGIRSTARLLRHGC
ncbi:unnamed protein product, partial [Trichogramma brassicae]